MVCPNCHSDQVIAVQDQHFCINCGQVVPEESVRKAQTEKKPKVPAIAVQENGLPEGVKILPVSRSADTNNKAESEPAPETPADAPAIPSLPSAPHINISTSALIKPRSRIAVDAPTEPEAKAAEAAAAEQSSSAPKPAKKRKPGRPKAGRLDTPRGIPALAPVAASLPKPAPLPPAPRISPRPEFPPHAGKSAPAPRRLSDIAPPRRPHPITRAANPSRGDEVNETKQVQTGKKFGFTRGHKKPAVHKLAVPPLHYGHVIAFSVRARVRPRLVGLAAAAALGFAAAIAYGVWLLLGGGLSRLADAITHGGARMVAEIGLLAAIYYIGRSVAQAAITYGVAREGDQRPVSLSHQLAVGINSFGRRLRLDAGFAVLELLLLAGVGALVLVGGETWPVDAQIQVAILFCVFMVLIYLLTALALARGLAGVALSLTTQTPWSAAKLGWGLFSHRFELLALRFFAFALELVLAVPLAALAYAFVAVSPARFHLLVTLGVGLLAWLAGALFGAGTAAWWASLYRNLVTADRPDAAGTLISGTQVQDARRGPLTLIVALTTLLVAAALAAPWLKF